MRNRPFFDELPPKNSPLHIRECVTQHYVRVCVRFFKLLVGEIERRLEGVSLEGRFGGEEAWSNHEGASAFRQSLVRI